jgi:hypothetical protein
MAISEVVLGITKTWKCRKILGKDLIGLRPIRSSTKFVAMKQLFVISILLLSLYGCNSLETDASKMASMQCEVKALTLQAMSGDEAAADAAQEMYEEIEALRVEIEQKYPRLEDQMKIRQLVFEESAECR